MVFTFVPQLKNCKVPEVSFLDFFPPLCFLKVIETTSFTTSSHQTYERSHNTQPPMASIHPSLSHRDPQGLRTSYLAGPHARHSRCTSLASSINKTNNFEAQMFNFKRQPVSLKNLRQLPSKHIYFVKEKQTFGLRL